jgi:hypothetical protein
MLQKNVVKRPLWDVLVKLQKEPLFHNFFLVGGTALSLQIGHRISEDIDLFTQNKIDKDMILDFLERNYKTVSVTNAQDSILQINIGGLKVDFVSYPYKLIEQVKTDEGIRFLGKKDIAAMKLAAVANRGNQAKDFVDLFFLLKEIPLKDMFDCYKEKYHQTDLFHVKKSIVYFADVPDLSWDTIIMVKGIVSKNEVKNTLIREMNNYNKEIAVSINEQPSRTRGGRRL